MLKGRPKGGTNKYWTAEEKLGISNRFLESVNDADYVCVLDTGSTDDTFKLLKRWWGHSKEKNNQTMAI